MRKRLARTPGGEKLAGGGHAATSDMLARRVAESARLVRTVAHAGALLARMVIVAIPHKVDP